MTPTSAEALLLLSFGDEQRPTATVPGIDQALAGGLLLDLHAIDALVPSGELLLAEPDVELEDALLREAYVAILTSPKQRTTADWVRQLPRELKPIQRFVNRALVERGILADRSHTTFLLVTSYEYEIADPEPARVLRRRITAVLRGERTPEESDRRLAGLLVAGGMIATLVAPSEVAAATTRALELSAGAIVPPGDAAGAVRTEILTALGASAGDAEAA